MLSPWVWVEEPPQRVKGLKTCRYLLACLCALVAAPAAADVQESRQKYTVITVCGQPAIGIDLTQGDHGTYYSGAELLIWIGQHSMQDEDRMALIVELAMQPGVNVRCTLPGPVQPKPKQPEIGA